MFTSKTPHFFKIILEETIRDGKLGIPRKFVRNHGKQLPSSIKLEVPTGAIWQVELTKSDGMVWIQKGWKEFAEHYSLEFGHFLVFRYEGNAHFHAMIFDKTASEIEYPYTSTEEDDDGDDDDDDDDLCVEICEDVLASRKSKEKSHFPCPRPHKKMRSDSPNQPGTDYNFEFLSSPISADKLGNLKKVEKSRCSTLQPDGVSSPASRRSVETEVLCNMKRLTATEKARAMQIASGLRSTGNPVFMVVMKPSFVRYRCKLIIPSKFGRRFFKMQIGILTLCDSTGKTWPARFFRSSDNKTPYAEINSGWQAFVEDNNLDVSDICVFELIKQPGILLKVVIHRAIKNANSPSADGNVASRVKIRSLASDTEANRRRKENENVDSDIEILDEFPLNQKTKKKLPFPCFQSCGFKSSAKDDSGGMSGARRCLKPDLMSKMKPLTQTEKETACIQANAFKSPNPSFTLVMQPSYVCAAAANPNIPCQFARKYFKKRGEVTLRVSDGRTWSVDYRKIVTSSYSSCNFCCNSWRAFALDNNLKVGDICVFELNKEIGNLLEVHFFSC